MVDTQKLLKYMVYIVNKTSIWRHTCTRGQGHSLNIVQGQSDFFNYTPGIYAEGYIVFVFPFVYSFVRSCFRPARGITSKFYVQST